MNDTLYALKAGQRLLDELRALNPEEYDKIMNEPIKGCKCGFIKEGDNNLCPHCEKVSQ